MLLSRIDPEAQITAGARGYYVIGNEQDPTLGDYFAEVLLLDQGSAAEKVRSELGWRPTRPSLTDEFRYGSYRVPSNRA